MHEHCPSIWSCFIYEALTRASTVGVHFVEYHRYTLILFSAALSFFFFVSVYNILDIMNVLNVNCNFIACCLLWQNLQAGVLMSLWKQSKVSYFRDSCIFYLISYPHYGRRLRNLKIPSLWCAGCIQLLFHKQTKSKKKKRRRNKLSFFLLKPQNYHHTPLHHATQFAKLLALNNRYSQKRGAFYLQHTVDMSYSKTCNSCSAAEHLIQTFCSF